MSRLDRINDLQTSLKDYVTAEKKRIEDEVAILEGILAKRNAGEGIQHESVTVVAAVAGNDLALFLQGSDSNKAGSKKPLPAPSPPPSLLPSTIAVLPSFAVDIDTGEKPGPIYGPSDGSTPITIGYFGIDVDPSMGMLGYPPAGKYYVILGTWPGIAWYDETATSGISDGSSPGLWNIQCYAGAHFAGDLADPSTWVCIVGI